MLMHGGSVFRLFWLYSANLCLDAFDCGSAGCRLFMPDAGEIRGLTIEQVRSRLAAGQVQEGRCHERVSTIPVGLSAERGQACGSGRPQGRCGGAVHEDDRHQSCQSGVAKAFPDIVGRTGWNCGGLGDCDEEAAIAQAARAAGGRCRQRVRGVDEDRQGAA